MNEPATTPRAGGFIIAVAIIVGALGGTILGQPSAGVLIGFAAGAAAAILIWLKDRRRR